jgi:hypothetical protein
MAESKMGQDFQSEVLNAIRKSQSVVVETIENLTGTVQAMRSSLPDLPFAENLSIADKLPKPEDLVRGAYDFAEQLLASQRKFAEDVLTAAGPLLRTGSAAGK